MKDTHSNILLLCCFKHWWVKLINTVCEVLPTLSCSKSLIISLLCDYKRNAGALVQITTFIDPDCICTLSLPVSRCINVLLSALRPSQALQWSEEMSESCEEMERLRERSESSSRFQRARVMVERMLEERLSLKEMHRNGRASSSHHCLRGLTVKNSALVGAEVS